MRQRRETVEHPFGTIKSWMGSTHFQMKTLKRVGTEIALHVLAYNLKRVMNIMGIGPLIEAMSAAYALVGFHLRPYPAESPLATANPGTRAATPKPSRFTSAPWR